MQTSCDNFKCHAVTFFLNLFLLLIPVSVEISNTPTPQTQINNLQHSLYHSCGNL